MNIAWNPHDKNLNLTQRAEISFRHTGPKPWSAPLRPIYLQFKPNKPTLAFQIRYTLQVSCYFGIRTRQQPVGRLRVTVDEPPKK